MAEINPEQFQNGEFGYDMRERVEEGIKDKFSAMGDNLAERLIDDGRRSVVVGGDTRVTTPELYDSFVQALRRKNVNVIGLGINLPTPLIYVGYELYGADAVAAVTASHSSWDWNGIKVNIRESRNAPSDHNNLLASYGSDVTGFYMSFLQRTFAELAPLKVAVDPLWGSYSGYSGEVLRSMNHYVISDDYLHNGKKGFPADLAGYSSDPHNHHNLEHLIEVVKDSGLDFGIAFDGDGDRVKFIDDQGEIVSEDEITALLGDYLVREYKRCWGEEFTPNVIAEIKSSRMVDDVVKKAGGKIVRERTGRVNIKRTMASDRGIIFGGELSGHYFFRKTFCKRPFYFVDTGEDGLFTALMVGKLIQQNGKSLSELRKPLPGYPTSGELRYKYRPEMKLDTVEVEINSILQHLEKSYQNDPRFELMKCGSDLRAEGTDEEENYCSVVFRNSNNNPQKFTFVLEANNQPTLQRMRDNFLSNFSGALDGIPGLSAEQRVEINDDLRNKFMRY